MHFFKGLLASILTYSFFIASFASQSQNTQAHTTLLIFMEASHALNEYAIKNISDLVENYTGHETNIVIQWHAEGKTAWRFHITNRSLVSDDIVNCAENTCQTLIESATWAHSTFPSNRFALILWGHGYGILDPLWNAQTKKWQDEHSHPEFACHSGVCGLRSLHGSFYSPPYKGMLAGQHFQRPTDDGQESIIHHSYMSNTMLLTALDAITHTILGKKIDYLGTDACSMSMLEVMYQFKNYAHVFSGAEDCELPDGYDYAALAQILSQHPLEPKELATTIVHDFDHYYRARTNIGHYTQAATDLTKIALLKENLDTIVDTYHAYNKEDSVIRLLISKARAATIQFSINQNYVDISHFYRNLLDQLTRHQPNKRAEKIHTVLTSLLAYGIDLVDRIVIANAVGRASIDAHGIAIYFPLTKIDRSYRSTLFAQESQWLSLLEDIVA